MLGRVDDLSSRPARLLGVSMFGMNPEALKDAVRAIALGEVASAAEYVKSQVAEGEPITPDVVIKYAEKRLEEIGQKIGMMGFFGRPGRK